MKAPVEEEHIRKDNYASFDPREKPEKTQEIPPPQQKPSVPIQSREENKRNSVDENEIGMKQEDLEAVGTLYDCIRELYKEKGINKDEKLVEEFDEHIKHVMNSLTAKLYSSLKSKIVYSSHVMKAKFSLYDICFSKIIDYCGTFDDKLQAVIDGIHTSHMVLFDEVIGNDRNIQINNEDTLLRSQTEQEAQKETTKQEHSEHLAQETAKLLEAAENLERENEKLREEKEALIMSFEQERRELLEQLNMLQEENAKYLNTIIKHSKENAENNLSKVMQSEYKTFFILS